ncbi:nucleoside 2-deoxyribosyltransferase (plasmid) [Streptomyces sp. NBC_01456]|uniref:nucleoside 2-deoxyribosyltransferase n=1 Tax=unclassified Streptomyces TaxID=2593676 RepID=UPI002E3633AE|nr:MULTISPECIES: nucleoside 2-deoxyribosyltransferase [unclassified Streptomyces]
MHYLAHRLFAAHDRALAAQLAHHLSLKTGEDHVFLPFCDTDEETLVADVKGRRLFELDQERLRRIRALTAIVHGPSPDDGVCMEIGYAAALGVPVLLVTTDFQDYSSTPDGPHTVFPDPLLDALATRIIRIPQLAPSAEPPAITRYAGFAARNHSQAQRAIEACVDAALQLPAPTTPITLAPVCPGTRSTTTVYAEPSLYAPPPAGFPGLAARQDITITGPTRFTSTDPLTAAHHDWTAALGSTRIVVDACGPETPPGAALLIGAARATGLPVAAYLPRSTYTHASGREPNYRNLMIQYGVDATLRSAAEVTAWTGA